METCIYLEIRTNRMRRAYEGILQRMEKMNGHMLFVIRQYNGKGAIVDAPDESIMALNVFQAPAEMVEAA